MALVLVGVFVAVFPLISAARLSRTALAELPQVSSSVFNDDQHRLAIFGNDFTVASRVYQGTTVEAVRLELVAAGYQLSGLNRLSTACCGSYDGVWVTLAELEGGDVVASLSPIDSDIQSSWPVFPILGSILVGSGLAVVNGRRLRS